MNGKIITITSGKGGVGKSTTTANLATALSEEGKKVIAIDLDIGLRNLDMLLGLENRIVYDIVNVMEGECKLIQAIIKDKKTTNLHFIAASQTKDKDILKEEKLKKVLEELKTQYDYILIDSPAGIESGFKHSIFMADIVLVVTTPEISAVRDADRVLGLLEKEDIKTHLIINRLKPELTENGNMLSVEDVCEIVNIPLIGILPDDNDIVTSTNLGEPIFYNKKSIFNKIYLNIAKRIITQKTIPFIDEKEYKQKGFLNKLKGFFK